LFLARRRGEEPKFHRAALVYDIGTKLRRARREKGLTLDQLPTLIRTTRNQIWAGVAEFTCRPRGELINEYVELYKPNGSETALKYQPIGLLVVDEFRPFLDGLRRDYNAGMRELFMTL